MQTALRTVNVNARARFVVFPLEPVTARFTAYRPAAKPLVVIMNTGELWPLMLVWKGVMPENACQA
jgi:hypothetical protein